MGILMTNNGGKGQGNEEYKLKITLFNYFEFYTLLFFD